MKRIFTVRLNIDEMCAVLDQVGEDGYTQWLAGFRLGLRGSQRCPYKHDTEGQLGYQMGKELLDEATLFHTAKSRSGKASADKRMGSESSTKQSTNGSTNGSTNRATKVQPSSIEHLVSNNEQRAASSEATPALSIDDRRRDYLVSLGAKMRTWDGEDLLAEWMACTKGMKQPDIAAVFAGAAPGIQWPSEFRRLRPVESVYG